MLAIEVDGGSHLVEEIALNDELRQERLESLGVKFIRFQDKEVRKKMQSVLLALENKIEKLSGVEKK